VNASRPVRSLLYVPGNAPEKLAKALTRGADGLILDLEDAVPPAQKEQARESVLRWLSTQAAPNGTQLWVRVNAGPLHVADVQALAGLPGLTGLVLAKTESPDEVQAVVNLMDSAGDTTTVLMPMVETAGAVLAAAAIAAQPRVHQLQVGEVDLTGQTGIDPGPDDAELGAVRTLVVLASAAAGIFPPLGPVSQVTADLALLEDSTRRLRRQGFLGRACIHPAQLEVVHRVFTPTYAEIADANNVLQLYDEAVADGHGVLLDPAGRLVDVAVLGRARKTLALAGQAVT